MKTWAYVSELPISREQYDKLNEELAVRPLAARQALDDIKRLRDVGRRRLGTVWFPLSVFGLIGLGMAPLALTVHRNHLAPTSSSHS
jgi:hypothetical protein